jgi:hypothetical protein
MAFGKRTMSAEVQAVIARDHEKKVVESTELKILRVPAPGTPLGDMHLIDAVETAMIEPPTTCPRCFDRKSDPVLVKTGLCAKCWDLYA